MSTVVTVNDLLDGQVGLDIECLDRVCLNGYVPTVQVGGQVVLFMNQHLGCPVPSPVIMEKVLKTQDKSTRSSDQGSLVTVIGRIRLCRVCSSFSSSSH